MSNQLSEIEGRAEVAAKIAIRKAGDGLNAPLRAEPRAYRLGEEVYVVLKTSVARISHIDATEGTGVIRVHDLDTSEATIVDEAAVHGVLAAQRQVVEELLQREAAAKGAIPFGEPDSDGEDASKPEGMSDEEWMASAAAQAPTPIGKGRRGGKAASDG